MLDEIVSNLIFGGYKSYSYDDIRVLIKNSRINRINLKRILIRLSFRFNTNYENTVNRIKNFGLYSIKRSINKTYTYHHNYIKFIEEIDFENHVKDTYEDMKLKRNELFSYWAEFYL